MTEICDVSFSYGSRKILDRLSFRVASSECVVLAGANGRGKSTVLSLIAGILHPSSGRIQTGGRVAYIPQGSALFENMTVAENLRFFATLAKTAVTDELPFNLHDYMNVKAGKLSGGMKKQLCIACSLLGEPRVILFDEPCAGLDIVYRRELIALLHSLKAKGCEIVYVGHDPMEFVSFCDRVLFLGQGFKTYSREELAADPADDQQFCENFARIFEKLSH